MPGFRPATRARVLHLALMLGTTLAVSVFLVVPHPTPQPFPALVYAAYGLAAVMFTAALVLAARLPRTVGPEGADRWWQANLPRALVIWSMLEGPALLAAVVQFITGRLTVLSIAAVGLFLFVLVTPRRLRPD